ncbi:MAG: TIGR03905 family TSCPD domain-containing protein [Lachnospiraceae bacterium]|nr:TIGR03905 family TSCPD domain-containing protein [Lachnospiraceae bacterium]
MYSYKTKGTCSREIQLDLEDGKILNCKFIGGCDGNTKGVSALVKGMSIDEAIARLKGIDCHGKGTSCPDQLALALESYKETVA